MTWLLMEVFSLMVDMYATETGGWIRIVIAVPSSVVLPLYAASVALLGFLGWRRRKGADLNFKPS